MLGTSLIAADGVIYLYYIVARLGLYYRAVYSKCPRINKRRQRLYYYSIYIAESVTKSAWIWSVWRQDAGYGAPSPQELGKKEPRTA